MGTDLVKLTFGLQGKPPSQSAVLRLLAFERSIKEEPDALRAMARANLYDRIEARVSSEEPAYATSATLPGVAVDLLIRGKKDAAALRAVKQALERFPNSVRLRQLYGLALRRAGQLDDAAYELNLLTERKHRDVETLGILASVWADLWEKRLAAGETGSARDALEQSRDLYSEGFNKVPTDTYTGINAAAKTALLGDLDRARGLADQVLARLREIEAGRGGGSPPDYWVRVTEPEALLIKGEYDRALDLYHAARVAYQNEAGSIALTATQVRRLLGVLPVPADIKKKLVAEFGLS
jgi:tetratricopeptide (TPR) repeat protein